MNSPLTVIFSPIQILEINRNTMQMISKNKITFFWRFSFVFYFVKCKSFQILPQWQTPKAVESKKLLDTILSDLNWRENTNFLVRKSYKRLEILRKLYEFDVPITDLIHIYTLYVRSVLEFNCCVCIFTSQKRKLRK